MSIISLMSDDVKTLRKFYEELTGQTPALQNVEYIEYEEPGLRWGFEPRELLEEHELDVDDKQVLIQMKSEDVKSDRQKLSTITEVLTEIKEAGWGDKYFFAKDPAGNLLYIYQKNESN